MWLWGDLLVWVLAGKPLLARMSLCFQFFKTGLGGLSGADLQGWFFQKMSPLDRALVLSFSDPLPFSSPAEPYSLSFSWSLSFSFSLSQHSEPWIPPMWNFYKCPIIDKGFPGGSAGKEFACHCRRCKRHRFDPWVGKIPCRRKPGEENVNPFQYSCLENPMDRGAWWAIVRGVAKSRTGLKTYSLRLRLSWKVTILRVYVLSRVLLFTIPWPVACMAPLSMGFSKQEYWSGLPFPTPGDSPDPWVEPATQEWNPHPLQFLHFLHWQVGSLPLVPWKAPTFSFYSSETHISWDGSLLP